MIKSPHNLEVTLKEMISLNIKPHDKFGDVVEPQKNSPTRNYRTKENRLDKQLQHLAQYKVLIIDEIGYLPVDHQGSNLFLQLIARRYMNK